MYGIQVALWLGINSQPDAKYAIITRDKETEFFNYQKDVLFVCKNTGLTDKMADDIIILLNLQNQFQKKVLYDSIGFYDAKG